jgi:hypothetical protein
MKAPIGELSPTLTAYSQDKNHFYRIIVQDRHTEDGIVPLPDLLADGTLNMLLDRVLEAQYAHLRTQRPSDFMSEKGDWKPFKEVKDRVGELYYAPLMKRLDQAIEEYRKRLPKYCQWDDSKMARVAVRFLPHLIRCSDKLLQDDLTFVTTIYEPVDATKTVRGSIEDRPLSDLFLLVSSKQHVARYNEKEKPSFAEALSLPISSWMLPRYSQELGPFVARIMSRGVDDFSKPLREDVFACQKSVGKEAVCCRAQQLIEAVFN